MGQPTWTDRRRFPPYASLSVPDAPSEVVTSLIWVMQDVEHPSWQSLPGLGIQVDSRQLRYWLPKDHPGFGGLADAAKAASPGRSLVRLILHREAPAILDIRPPE